MNKNIIFSVLGIVGAVVGGIAEILKTVKGDDENRKIVEEEVQKALAEQNKDEEEDKEETEEENK